MQSTVPVISEDFESKLLQQSVSRLNQVLLPYCIAVVLLCYLDRTSVAFAALQLCALPWFTAAVYGLGSGLFYAGYIVFQVPSSVFAAKVGPGRWLSIITLGWGLSAAACAMVGGVWSFLLLRLLLGAAESGAFPTMWYLLALFYPDRSLTVPYSALESAAAVGLAAAAPIAAALFQLDGAWGLRGWQWLFIVEGTPCLALGIALWYMLPNDSKALRFVSKAQLARLAREKRTRKQPSRTAELGPAGANVVPEPTVARAGAAYPFGTFDKVVHIPVTSRNEAWDGRQGQESMEGSEHQDHSGHDSHPAQTGMAALVGAVCNPQYWYLAVMKLTKDITYSSLVYWTPLLLASILSPSLGSHHTAAAKQGRLLAEGFCTSKSHKSVVALFSTIPYICASFTSVGVGYSSQKSNEQKLHIAVPLLAGSMLLVLLPVALQHSAVLAFVLLTAAIAACNGTTGVIYSWVQSVTKDETSTVAFAFVNSISNIGSIVGPYVFGLLYQATNAYASSIVVVSICMFVSGLLAILWPWEEKRNSYSALRSTDSDIELHKR